MTRDLEPGSAPRRLRHQVRAPKTAELIAGHIRAQIVRGELASGDALPSETALMRQFGVSRPTLREGFRILEAESLLAIRRGSRGGAQVMAPSRSVASRYVGLLLQTRGATIGDIYQARMVLEPACARLLALDHSEAQLADLRAASDELHRHLDGDVFDPARWLVLTHRFQQLVIEGAGSKTLALQGALLQDIAASHTASSVSRSRDRDATSLRFRLLARSCTRLVGLVQAGDGAGAEQHWRAHMEATARTLAGNLEPTTVVNLFHGTDQVTRPDDGSFHFIS